MVPIVSVGNSITFIVASLITIYIWRIYRKKREERLKYFFYFFASISLLFLSISLPFLILKNEELITISVSTTPAFLYLTLIFISIVSFRILNWHKIEKTYLIIIIISLFFSYLMIFFKFDLIKIAHTQNFIYWFIPRERIFWQIGSSINGIISGATLFFLVIFFFISGIKSRERFIKKRAFFIAIGLFFLTLAGVINFIIGAVPNFSVHIIASVLSVLGILNLFSGVILLRQEN